MERTLIKEKYEDTKQIKLFQAGCQTYHRFITSANDIYFAFASTMTVNVYDLSTFQLRSIINPNLEKMIKCIAINQGTNKELAVFYDVEILIYSIPEEKILERYKCPEPRQMEFNKDNKLLIIGKNGDIHYLDFYKKKIEPIKINGKASIARWYPFDSAELAYGNNDKKVISVSLNTKIKSKTITLDIKDDVFICELSWYNLDESYKYILIGLSDGCIQLNEFVEGLLLMKFEKFGTCTVSLCWLKHEPGSFISSSKNSAKLAKWNVSNKNYNSVFKISELSVLQMENLQGDPTKILATCEDGSVIIHDLKSNKLAFKLEPGHSESIFDLKYSKHNYGVFATCSHDGSIKIWDINKNKVIYVLRIDSTLNFMKTVGKSQNSDNAYQDSNRISILSLKWSPNEKNYLLSGDSSGTLRLWDISKEKLLDFFKFSSTMKEPKEIQILGIDWDEDNNIVCSGNENVNLFKFENGKFIFKSKFESSPPTVLFQVKFNPFESLTFYAGGLDGTIKVFNEKSKKNISELKGHLKKVFGICFNPERSGILASSSDDFKIGIWDLAKNNKVSFISGHTNNVRQLVWLKDNSNILISGGWDGNIKFWNIDILACVYTISEHYSDVYGLDICSDHPYLLMSSSRDNSIRFWNIPIFADKLIDYIINFKNPPMIREYKELNSKLSRISEDDIISKAETISNFFFYSDGIMELWDILKVVTKQKEFCKENNKIFYLTDLYSAYKSRINNNEFMYFSKNKFEYNRRRDDLIHESIDLCAKIGDWEKFCELNIEINQWEKAIMAAPHCGLEYWKQLLARYSEYTNKNNTAEKKFSSLLSGNMQPALDVFMETNDYEDAKLIWLTRGEGQKSKNKIGDANTPSADFNDNNGYFNSLENRLRYLSKEDSLNVITYHISRKYLISGDPLMAASNFLSVKDTFNTIKTLIRANELEIAYMFMKIINDNIYEEDIYFGLCLKEYKKGNLENVFNIINTCDRKEIKFTLCSLIGNLNTNLSSAVDISEYLKRVNLSKNEIIEHCEKTKDMFLFNIVSSNYKEAQDYVYNLFETLSRNLSDLKNAQTETIDHSTLEKLMRCLFILKGVKLNCFEDYKRFQIKIYLIIALLECLNRNLRAAELILIDLNRLVKANPITENSEKLIFSFILYVIKNEKNKIEESVVDNLLRIYKEHISIWNNYNKILEAFKITDDLYVLKYYTNDIPYFYILREEIFPTNINNRPVSAFNSKNIKGKCIKLSQSSIISFGQALEWCKYITIPPMTEESKLFYPY